MHDYQKIAAIVGEDKIEALREAGVNIADKPAKPTTGLLGRWAKDRYDGDVLIISERVTDDGGVWVTFRTSDGEGGTATIKHALSELTFPEEATRPEDVPVGEAWLVKAPHYVGVIEQSVAVKASRDLWITVGEETSDTSEVEDAEVTLIAPLVPAHPADTDREHMLETVTTEEEYAALPIGSIVAEQDDSAYLKGGDTWLYGDTPFNYRAMNGTTRTVLRKGWGE